MKQVIGIVDQSSVNYDETVLNIGCGGSESWTIYLAKQLVKDYGYHVIVFNNCNHWHFDTDGVEWVPYELFFDSRIEYQRFDYIIITRLYKNLIGKIISSKCCDKIIIQSHDWGLDYWDEDNFKYPYYEEMWELQVPEVKAIVGLSEWHLQSMIDQCHIPAQLMTIIPNGVDDDLISNSLATHTVDKHILWSSRPERGCDILCDEILPKLRRHDNEWQVDIASYDPIQDRFLHRESEGINCLGRLSKSRLYDEMHKHAVWFYPSIYPETFNISLIEAIMCGNMPILPLQHGMATTLDLFSAISMKNKFYNQWHVKDGNDILAIDEAVELILYSYDHYHDYSHDLLRRSMRNHIIKNYSWKHVAEMYVELFNKIK